METQEVVALTRLRDRWSPDARAAGYPLVRLTGERFRVPTDQIPGLVAQGLVFDPSSSGVDWWRAPRRILAHEPARGVEPWSDAPTPGSLRIVQGCGYDPGQAAYRLHAALNEWTQHASAFVRWGDTNPYSRLRQWDGERDRELVRRLVYEADVVHCHMDYLLIGNTDVQPRGLVIRHYHGSRSDGRSNVEPALDAAVSAITLGARLQLLSEGPGMQWLPIPVPVDRYRALRQSVWRPAREFRVAHSPTKRSIKGTQAFIAACETLRRRGLGIRAVLIEQTPMAEALVLKARCDAVFDAFWLGLQGSGLEGAAMGLPVVAGDREAAALYRQHVGQVPYTFADSEAELVQVLERLVLDAEWRSSEAARVAAYTREYHDYRAVARRYEQILARALGRDDVLTAGSRAERPAGSSASREAIGA